jgi:hypothetical protein
MSHHYSGPQLGFPHGDARLDFNDLYALPKPGDAGKSILIVNVHPSAGLEPPGRTTSIPFAANAIYEFRIDTNGDKVADVTYRVVFSPFTSGGQTATLRLITGPQAAAEGDGELLIENAAVSLDAKATVVQGRGHRFFAGPFSSILPAPSMGSNSPRTSSPTRTCAASFRNCRAPSWGPARSVFGHGR